MQRIYASADISVLTEREGESGTAGSLTPWDHCENHER